MKNGLILEGGAMRGLFSAGVMDVMMEEGIRFDGAIGVSAGAAFGCNYKSGQIGRVIRYNTKYGADPRYSGLRVLMKEGNLFSTEFCYDELPMKLDPFDFDEYRKNPMEFYVVCTDIETGKPVYHRYEGLEDHGFDWIRASASLPMVSQTVVIDGKKLLDGGISDSIPLRFFEGLGYERNVVILTQPKGYVKKRSGLTGAMRLCYPGYPKMIDALANRHIHYNETLRYIEQQEKSGNVLVIRPDTELQIGRAEQDPKKMRAVYEIGRATAKKQVHKITSFLKGEM